MYRAIRDLVKPPTHNVTSTEKWLSIGGGLLLIGKGLRRPGPLGWAHLAVGAATVFRGVAAYSPASQNRRRRASSRRLPRPRPRPPPVAAEAGPANWPARPPPPVRAEPFLRPGQPCAD